FVELSGVRKAGGVIADRRAEVSPNVERLVKRKRRERRPLGAGLTDLVAVDAQTDYAALAGPTGVRLEVDDGFDLAFWKRIGTDNGMKGFAEVIEDVAKLVVLYIDRPAPRNATHRDDDPIGGTCAGVEFRGDAVAPADRVGRRAFRN